MTTKPDLNSDHMPGTRANPMPGATLAEIDAARAEWAARDPMTQEERNAAYPTENPADDAYPLAGHPGATPCTPEEMATHAARRHPRAAILAGIEASTRNGAGVPVALVDAVGARANELTALLREGTEHAAAYQAELDALDALAAVWVRLPRLDPAR